MAALCAGTGLELGVNGTERTPVRRRWSDTAEGEVTG
jgi:hypothetical protein